MNISSEEKRYRYPGVQPFTEKDHDTFNGRDSDLAILKRKLYLQNIVVLQSKSGYGKSSLINAGLIPQFELGDDEYYYLILNLQFDDLSKSPLQIFNKYLSAILEKKREIASQYIIQSGNQDLQKYLEYELNLQQVRAVSIWQYLKSIEFLEKIIIEDDALKSNKQLKFFIVLDQFEKLLLYSDENKLQIEELGRDLADIYYKKIPTNFQEALQLERYSDGEVVINPKFSDFWNTHPEWEVELQKDINVCILIGIRTDKLILIDRLSKIFPDLSLNKYELPLLSIEDAKRAIIVPASLEKKEKFYTHSFVYDNGTIEKIINFLTKKTDQEGLLNTKKFVEAYQLQMICQHIEEKIIKKGFNGFDLGETYIVMPHDIEDMEEIVRNYYVKEIAKFPLKDKKKVEVFIENNLVDDRAERRVIIEQTVAKKKLKELGINEMEADFILSKLESTSTRIIRSDFNHLNHVTLELSHDRLVKPVLEIKKKRDRKKKRVRMLLLGLTIIILTFFVIGSWIYIQRQEINEQITQLNKTILYWKGLSNAKIFEYRMDSLKNIESTLKVKSIKAEILNTKLNNEIASYQLLKSSDKDQALRQINMLLLKNDSLLKLIDKKSIENNDLNMELINFKNRELIFDQIIRTNKDSLNLILTRNNDLLRRLNNPQKNNSTIPEQLKMQFYKPKTMEKIEVGYYYVLSESFNSQSQANQLITEIKNTGKSPVIWYKENTKEYFVYTFRTKDLIAAVVELDWLRRFSKNAFILNSL
jgi:hypothetical protein